MAELSYNEQQLRMGLAALDLRSSVAFALSCAERLLPNYRAFVREHSWGDARPLRNALDGAWAWLRGDGLGADGLAALSDACATEAPDTENFDSLLVSPALDAANAASLVADLIITGDKAKAAEVAVLALDTVDMYVQEIAEIPANAPDLEDRIRLHPLMQREISRQLEDIRLLTMQWNEQDLFKRWSSQQTSNIGLT